MTLEPIIEQARLSTPWRKMRLIQAISPDIEQVLIKAEIKPRRSLWEIYANLGASPFGKHL
jgi:hypothetical protein